jgi:hypothetical protein
VAASDTPYNSYTTEHLNNYYYHYGDSSSAFNTNGINYEPSTREIALKAFNQYGQSFEEIKNGAGVYMNESGLTAIDGSQTTGINGDMGNYNPGFETKHEAQLVAPIATHGYYSCEMSDGNGTGINAADYYYSNNPIYSQIHHNTYDGAPSNPAFAVPNLSSVYSIEKNVYSEV